MIISKEKQKRNTKGITLISLVITIIVLLILAGVSLSGIFSDKGIFHKAESAGAKYNEAKAMEVLETVLTGIALYEKYSNPKYDQDGFLDEIIRNNVEGGDAKGDTAIAGDYVFALDRSVPKLGDYLGKKQDLVWPTITISDPVLADNYKTSSFTVTTIEEINGISKIEVWLNGQRIDNFTREYTNEKTEIKETFTVNKNGKYTVKVYSKLSNNATTEVTGIVPAVEFSPDGDTTWKKEHSTKITVKQTGETIAGMKYLWTESGSNEPKPEQFPESNTCTNNSTITEKDITGTYYLWVLLTLEGNKTTVCGSRGFNFDNEGPTVTLTSSPVSENSFVLTATASDTNSGISRYEFYVDDKLLTFDNTDQLTTNCTWTGTGMFKGTASVKVYDKLGNMSSTTCECRTLLHTWTVNAVVVEHKYYFGNWTYVREDNFSSTGKTISSGGYAGYMIDQSNGSFRTNGVSTYGYAIPCSDYVTEGGYMYRRDWYYVGPWPSGTAHYVNAKIYRGTLLDDPVESIGAELEPVTSVNDTEYQNGTLGDKHYTYKRN